jgi:Flp pilus assembly protein protease CpaA
MTELNYELLRVAVALAGTAYLAWQDARTSFMDERVLYAMAGAGLLLNLLVGSLDFLIPSVGLAAAVFAFGYAFYRVGQLGGGDVWLFTALQLLLPLPAYGVSRALASSLAGVVPDFSLAAAASTSLAGGAYPFILSVAAASAFFALWGSAFLYARKLRGHALKPDQALLVALVGGLLVVFYYLNSVLRISPGLIAFLVLLFLPSVFLTSFKRQLLDEVVVRKIPLREVEDEDILVLEKMPERLVKKYRLGRVLTKAEVAKLRALEKREGLHRFPVAKVLPRFGPYVLLGLLACLLVGDLFAFALLL